MEMEGIDPPASRLLRATSPTYLVQYARCAALAAQPKTCSSQPTATQHCQQTTGCQVPVAADLQLQPVQPMLHSNK